MEIGIGKYSLIVELPAENIGMLIFLILLTTGAYIYMRRLRKERTVKIGNFQTLKDVHGKKSVASPSVLIIKIFTITMLFMVATGSITILSTEPVSDTDFVVAIDNSQTMLIPDYPPDRLGFTKSTTSDWIQRLPAKTNVSIISFAGDAQPVETTTVKENGAQAISSIRPELDSSGTAIGDAIDLGTNILADTDAKKKIILITDGTNTAGMNISTAIDNANKENVTVDIIGISSTDQTTSLYQNLSKTLESSGLNGSVKAPEINEEELRIQAQSTGGNFYSITNQNFFEESLKDIVLQNDTVRLDSSYYVLIFISLLLISEMLLYSKFGAI